MMMISKMENKQEDFIFADGIIAKAPSEKAKEFIKLKLSFRVLEFKNMLDKQNNEGWVNLDMRKSKKTGEYYFTVNTWKPEKLPNPDEESPF